MNKWKFSFTLSVLLVAVNGSVIAQQTIANPIIEATLSSIVLNSRLLDLQKMKFRPYSFAGQESLAVSPLYNATHVYVKPEDYNRFTDSFIATFGGTKSQQGVYQVTPTPSQTISQFVLSPVGTLSVFGFKTPMPYPFGEESIGYLVKDFDQAVQAAKRYGAEVIVEPFTDLAGRDAVIRWSGGFTTQLYWIESIPNFAPLKTIPESRVYISKQRADQFVKSYLNFSRGRVISDNLNAPGIEIGQPNERYRRIRIESNFGKIRLFVTDGHLPFPYGRETTGFEVENLVETLKKAQNAGAKILVNPYQVDGHTSALVQFPGDYIAEIHTHND